MNITEPSSPLSATGLHQHSSVIELQPVTKVVARLRSPRHLQKQTSKDTTTVDCTALLSSSRFKDFSPLKPTRFKSKQKQVRFMVDMKGRIKPDVLTYVIYEDTAADCFYRHDERILMKTSALMAATEYTINHYESIYAMECVLGSPLRPHDTTINDKNATVELLVTSEGKGEVRGLEFFLSDLLRRHKQWATYGVLKLQKKLQQQEIPFREREQRLRARCEQLNQATRELALRLARADEKEARKIYLERELS